MKEKEYKLWVDEITKDCLVKAQQREDQKRREQERLWKDHFDAEISKEQTVYLPNLGLFY